ncbi:MAG: hypothetical protein PHO27_11140 [Sulfuricurvum sp.]|nr:hypothetical protein [Sulfuricurvum sp.]
MDTTTLILTMIALLFLLVALVSVYVWIGRSAKASPDAVEVIETFDTLSFVIKNAGSSSAQLRHASTRIVENFGRIDSRNVNAYRELVQKLCTHRHVDSKIILNFEKGLRQINPNFAHEIEEALALGLAARDKMGT